MTRLTLIAALGLPVLLLAACGDHAPLAPDQPRAAAGAPNVVQVADPTGNPADDRASIMAALGQVRPGSTIRFAAGTYVIGVDIPFSADFIRVTVPGVNLEGHPAGTTLRGCEPAQLVFGGCVGLELSGGGQTVRGLTFEDMHFALVLGAFSLLGPTKPAGVGGYLVEKNTFQRVVQGVHQAGEWPQPAVVRHNTFVNTFAAVLVGGMTVHVVDNHISAPDPASIPFVDRPGSAITISPASAGQSGRCDHNIIARNRVEGHPESIVVWLVPPVEGCRHNVIRDNTIVDSGSRADHGIPFHAGAPIALVNQTGQEGRLEHTLVEGNRITGAVGLAVDLFGAGHNRVVNNTVTGVTPAGLPFPTTRGPGPGPVVDGSAIRVSAGSENNRILANTFTDVASYAVVLEGDHNRVATTSVSDDVLDLGSGNRVTGPK